MKQLIAILAFILPALFAHCTFTDTAHLYNPAANATTDIAKAVALAKKEHKFVFIQAGGNWCVWCLRFNKFTTEDAQIDSLIKANFIVYHLNWSKENYNDNIFAQYGYPQRFGFPVFIVLDENGKQIHTQNSGYLEQDKGYSKDKVMGFFRDWMPSAFDPKNYKNQ